MGVEPAKENIANTKKFSRPRKVILQQVELASKNCAKNQPV